MDPDDWRIQWEAGPFSLRWVPWIPCAYCPGPGVELVAFAISGVDSWSVLGTSACGQRPELFAEMCEAEGRTTQELSKQATAFGQPWERVTIESLLHLKYLIQTAPMDVTRVLWEAEPEHIETLAGLVTPRDPESVLLALRAIADYKKGSV